MDRLTGESSYYDFVAGSFHSTRLRTRLHSIEVEFYRKTKKKQKIAFEPPFKGHGGSVLTAFPRHAVTKNKCESKGRRAKLVEGRAL